MIIKKIEKKDLMRFADLWNQDFQFLTSSKFKMTCEKAVKGFDSRMFDYFGLYLDDLLIGFLLLKEDNDVLWGKHMLVDKKHRGKGYGALLVNKAKEESRNRSKKLMIEILETNEPARKLFLKNGFKEVSFDKNEGNYIYEWQDL